MAGVAVEAFDLEVLEANHPEWRLADYDFNPLSLVATKRNAVHKDMATGVLPMGQQQPTGFDMEMEEGDEFDVMDPALLVNAPLYIPAPAGCKNQVCQVVGCGVSLEGMKGYFLRHRVCEDHSKSPVLMIGDQPSRLCQQCSKFHPVQEFEGMKRTCRVQLDRIRINKRLRRSRKQNAAATAAAAAMGLPDAAQAAAAPCLGKRPADSSGSGDGSWADSRKARHVAINNAPRMAAGMGQPPSIFLPDMFAGAPLAGMGLLSGFLARGDAGGSGGLSSGEASRDVQRPPCSDAPTAAATAGRWHSGAVSSMPLSLSPPQAAGGLSTTPPSPATVTCDPADVPAPAGGCATLQHAGSSVLLAYPSEHLAAAQLPGVQAQLQALQQQQQRPHASGDTTSNGCSPDPHAPAQPMAPGPPSGAMGAPAGGSDLLPRASDLGGASLAAPQPQGSGRAPSDAAAGWHAQQRMKQEQQQMSQQRVALHPLLQQQLLQQAAAAPSAPSAPRQATPEWSGCKPDASAGAGSHPPQQQQQQQLDALALPQGGSSTSDPMSDAGTNAIMPLRSGSINTSSAAVRAANMAAAAAAAPPAEGAGLVAVMAPGLSFGGPPKDNAGSNNPHSSNVFSSNLLNSSVLFGSGNVFGGSNASNAKLIRMSLENDDNIDDAALLGTLVDLLTTQNGGPSGEDRSKQELGLSAPMFLGPGSHGSGNGPSSHYNLPGGGAGPNSLAAAVAAGSNGAGKPPGQDTFLCATHAFPGITPVGIMAPGVGMSRAGSAAAGSPAQAMALLGPSNESGLAINSSLLGGTSTLMSGGSNGLFEQNLLNFARSSMGINSLPGTTGAGGSMPMPIPSAGVGANAALLDDLLLGARMAPGAPMDELSLARQLLLQQQQQLILQQQQLMQQQAAAQMPGLVPGATGAPAVPAAGLLLSRLLDADSKTHHLSSELNGCLAEKLLLRRQLLATLASGQLPPDVAAHPALVQAQLQALQQQQQQATGLSAATAAALQQQQQNAMLAAALQQQQQQQPNAMLLGAGGVPSMLGPVFPGGAGAGLVVAPGMAQQLSPAQQAALAGQLVPPGMGGAAGPVMAGNPAAQLQALTEARVAAMGGVQPQQLTGALAGTGGAPMAPAPTPQPAAAGAGGAAVAAPPATDMLTRVSLKIMNCLPDELPQDVRARMQAFANMGPMELVQGCLRPGCVEVVLDALYSGDEAALIDAILRHGDAAAAAAALLAVLPPALAAKDLFLQAGDQVLCLSPGAAPRRTSYGAVSMRRGGVALAKPELLCVEERVVVLEAPAEEGPGMDAGARLRLRVRGRSLAAPGVALLARMAGLALQVTVTPAAAAAAPTPSTSAVAAPDTRSASPTPFQPASTAATSPTSSPTRSCEPSEALPEELYDVEVVLPEEAPLQGLLILEPRAGFMLGAWSPVLVVEDRAVAAEVEDVLLAGMAPEQARHTLVSLGLLADQAERCAAYTDGEPGRDGAAADPEVAAVLAAHKRGGDAMAIVDDLQSDAGADAGTDWCAVFGPVHKRIIAAGFDLLAFAALRGCPHVMACIGSQLVDMGEPLARLPAATHGSVDLLACAVTSGSSAAVRIAAEWAARSAMQVDWRAQVPGQLGATLLHMAATLPMLAAVEVLDTLWSVAAASRSPESVESFAIAWFDDGSLLHAPASAASHADDGAAPPGPSPASTLALSPPSVLFHALAQQCAHAPHGHLMTAAVHHLDQLCLSRLASSYIRVHNYTSPLDHVDLPCTDSNTGSRCSGGHQYASEEDHEHEQHLDAMEGVGEAEGPQPHTPASDEARARAGAHGRQQAAYPQAEGRVLMACQGAPVAVTACGVNVAGLAAAAENGASRSRSRTRSGVLAAAAGGAVSSGSSDGARACTGADSRLARTGTPQLDEQVAVGDRSGHGANYERQERAPAYDPSAEAVARAVAAASGPISLAAALQYEAHDSSMVPAAATASPMRMRVSVAPKLALEAAQQQARRNASAHAGSVAGSAAAAHACPPSSYLGDGSSACASGSIPIFGSNTTMGDLLSGFGRSSFAFTNHGSLEAGMAGSGAAGVSGGAMAQQALKPLEPLLHLFRPLPESPNKDMDVEGASQPGDREHQQGQPRQEQQHGSCRAGAGPSCGGEASRRRSSVRDGTAGRRSVDAPTRAHAQGSSGAPAEAGGDVDGAYHEAPAACGTTGVAAEPRASWPGMPAAAVAEARAATGAGSRLRHAKTSLPGGSGGLMPSRASFDSAAAAAAAARLEGSQLEHASGSVGATSHMRGLAKMFKRLFNRKSSGVMEAGAPEQQQ